MNIYLDIETIPTQKDHIKQSVLAGIKAPGNYKDPEKIRAYCEAQEKEAVHKTSLSGLFGEVWCIGWAVEDEPAQVVTRQGLQDPELDVLAAWFVALDKAGCELPLWIGHNVLWDLRFLWHRSVVNKTRAPVGLCHDAKPWSDCVNDTMGMWAGYKDHVSLNNLCLALGIDTKGDLDGSKVWDYVQVGRWEEVAEYCKADVDRARMVHNRLTFRQG